MTDTLELKVLIFRKGLSLAKLAKQIGVSIGALSYKTNGQRPFNQDEILKISQILELTPEQMMKIFFPEVCG